VMTYPTRWLLGVIDDPAGAADAGDALMADGFAADDVRVLVGAAGREQLAGLGSRPNVLSRLVRAVAFTTMDQLPDFLVYERAIEDGRAVVAVRTGTRSEIQRIRRTLERFGGHFLNYYGRLSTEELSLWRGEEPTIPDVLRR
jgi:superfamily II DNA helicase RecQ